MSYHATIENLINNVPALKIIDAQKLRNEKFMLIPEQAYFKVFSRLEKKGTLKRVSKGVYCKPKKSKYGTIISNEENILDYYLGANGTKGVIKGYRLFNKYRLTTQIAKNIEIYSTELLHNQKALKNVKINKIELMLNPQTIKLIELLEVLQEYKEIEDLNKQNLFKYLGETVRYYNEKTITKIIKSMNYRKSTIASLENVLNYYGIENSLKKFLNSTSKYETIQMESSNEFTH